ncbi:MAG TPA: YkgJ family cysteine cluster protein [Terriglobales bacterium]|jgi:Fe-S-cluster containining protein|nr:YkgJ family cysteine cluster protein [Terriglobales bacterium]
MSCHSPACGDQQLIQIVDAALADSARRSGKWLACRPGCSQCCMGVFAINQLDALRLRNGLAQLEQEDPARAARIRERARASVVRLSPDFPGDLRTGVIEEDTSDEACQRWDDFGNDEPCPVLDPQSGTCDLYEYRPVTCRSFGPPLMADGGLGVCELCFEGATDAEIAACEMKPDPENLEAALLEELRKTKGAGGETIIAFALARGQSMCRL